MFKIVSGLVFRSIEWTCLSWEIVTARSCQCRTSVLGFQLKHALTKKFIQLNIFFQIGFNLKPILKLLRSIKNWVSPTPVSMAYWFVFVFCFLGFFFRWESWVIGPKVQGNQKKHIHPRSKSDHMDQFIAKVEKAVDADQHSLKGLPSSLWSHSNYIVHAARLVLTASGTEIYLSHKFYLGPYAWPQ